MPRFIPRPFLIGLLCLGLVPAAQAGPKPAPKKPGPKPVEAWVMPVRLKGEGLEPATARLLGKALIVELKELGVFQVLGGKQLSAKTKALREKKVLVTGCEDKPACVRAVGRQLGARLLFHLQIGRAQEGLTLTMRTFDVKSGKMVRQSVERADERPEDLERAVRWAARRVSSPVVTTVLKGKGRLTIEPSESGANLFLNGKSFGKKMDKAFRVSAGVFDVQVKKEGFETFHDVVVVRPAQDLVVAAALRSLDRRAAPVDAVAVAPAPGDVTLPDKPVEPPPAAEKPKEDLPAWAIFDRPKPGPETDRPPPTGPEASKPAVKTAVVVTPDPERPPYLPGEGPAGGVEADSEDTPVYKSWWLWTIIGVAVVGAGVATAVVLTQGGGSQDVGGAVLSWQ